MYQVGDLVLYGSTGVCRVADVTEQRFPSTGEPRMYYVLRPLYEDCVISAPVGSDKVFMRPIISRGEAEELLQEMPTLEPESYHSKMSREVSEHYETILHSHDCRMLSEMVLSIHRKKEEFIREKRKFGTVDERFLKRAEDLLFGELAAALDVSREQVQLQAFSSLEGARSE